MGIVVNVPRDERFGDLGAGIGALTGAIIQNRKKKDRVKLLGEVSAGTKTVEQAVKEGGDESLLNAILAARKNYTANNPSKTFVQTDDVGARITEFRQGRVPKPGEIPIDVARFNKPAAATTPTDKGREINDIIDAESATWNVEGVEEKRLPSVKRTMARNVRDLQNLSNDYIKSVSKIDRFGNITGTNSIKVAAYEEAINGHARGISGFDRVLGKQDISRRAKAYADEAWRLAEAEGMTEQSLIDEETDAGILQSVAVKLRQGGYHGAANVLDPEGMWSEPGGGAGEETVLPETILDKPAAAVPASPLEEVDRYVAGLAAVEESGIDVTANYGMVDIGPQMPLVPEDVMIVARELGTNEAVELYRSIYPNELTAVPLPLLEQRIQQNMHKQPMSFDIQATPAAAPAAAVPPPETVPGVPVSMPVPGVDPSQRKTAPNEASMDDIRNFMRQNLTIKAVTPQDVVQAVRYSPEADGKIILDPDQQQVAEFMRDNGLGTFQIPSGKKRDKRNVIEFDPDWDRVLEFIRTTAPETITQ